MFKVTQLGVLEPGRLKLVLPRSAACFPPDLTHPPTLRNPTHAGLRRRANSLFRFAHALISV